MTQGSIGVTGSIGSTGSIISQVHRVSKVHQDIIQDMKENIIERNC